VTYAEYLQTPHWRSLRAWALERAGNRCQLCGSAKELEVHHNTYERLGCEWPSDLVVLCDPCHERHSLAMRQPEIGDMTPLVAREAVDVWILAFPAENRDRAVRVRERQERLMAELDGVAPYDTDAANLVLAEKIRLDRELAVLARRSA
jgi:hypothetical protein